jgi:hypothetical protein
MIISQSQEEMRAAAWLQQKCELRDITLRQCHVSLEGSEDRLKGPFALKVSHNSIANAITDGILRIEVRFQIQCYDSSEPAALLFSVESAFDADYEIEDRSFAPTPESIAAFKDGNAIFNCWPYAREFVQSMTGRMAVHPPPLPFLRVIPKQEDPSKKAAKTPYAEAPSPK